MAIIDPEGLFHGSRLQECSDRAQLFWPRFLLASNGFGRIHLDYSLLLKGPLASLKKPPTMTEILVMFKEYRDNFLAFMYIQEGELWAQWDLPLRLISKYQTAADRRSPEPPAAAFDKWKQDYGKTKLAKTLDLLNYEVVHTTSIESIIPENFQTTSNHLDSSPLGIGIGDGNKPYVESKSDSTLVLLPQNGNGHAITPIWEYFVEKLGKSSVYEFSEKRKAMGKRCYEWALKRTRDPSKAEDWMKIGIDELSRSDYHMGRGKYQGQTRYCDWENVFKTVDKFQWWLERNNEKCQ